MSTLFEISLRILFLLIALAGPIILQIFLSKGSNKWLGLVLPVINFIFSIMAVLGITIFADQSTAEILIQFITIFLVFNIPTIILLSIYFACREKLKKNKQIDKMKIQDLN
ncbi:MAG: hypothetical protein H7Y18_05680 [Clostridiaceae bacterium]|nr:hypothetical protein [Clostridiaceae bacterium]